MARILLIATLLLGVQNAAFAWGAEGHRIIALIAADELTPVAKSQVQQLLGADDAAAGMMAVSTWADEIRRNRPNTAPWHFTDTLQFLPRSFGGVTPFLTSRT